ncbi:DUF1090 domain-containing protein [Stutzerimonas sp. VN223-3]|uniref:DUF1090 domain-containing protein n=1 Tax=Stutzerimonas sp. VN223-3 TaxID=3384601 RepID=UPI0038B4CB51
MKTIVAVTILLLTTGLAHAQESCAEKEAEIRRQLENARDQDNTGHIRGLETALSKARTNCTEAGLRADRQKDIDEAQEEISEREADLQKALRDGDPKKIKARKHKLDESRKELREILKD